MDRPVLSEEPSALGAATLLLLSWDCVEPSCALVPSGTGRTLLADCCPDVEVSSPGVSRAEEAAGLAASANDEDLTEDLWESRASGAAGLATPSDNAVAVLSADDCFAPGRSFSLDSCPCVLRAPLPDPRASPAGAAMLGFASSICGRGCEISLDDALAWPLCISPLTRLAPGASSSLPALSRERAP